jgi:rhodanese-related sulfurtransferase
VKRVLQEGALVAVIGAALAFVANGLSPYRYELTRDYFHSNKMTSPAPAPATNVTGAATAPTNSPLELLSARLRNEGLQLVDTKQAMQLFRDPRRELEEVIFIDARDDDHYQAGHIPRAFHFYQFHPENYLTNVVQVCLTAQQIVFYCNGGDCDESEHTAIYLRDSIGIPKEKVFVYGGGMNEWTTNGLPIEVGARNSGQFTNVTGAAASGKVEGSKQ